MIPAWANKYIGVPFRDFGFDTSGWHCWGLVRYVLLHERGIELPTYGEISVSELIKVAHLMKYEPEDATWIKVDKPYNSFDVLLMRGDAGTRAAVHCGIMVSPSIVMHVRKGVSTVAVPVMDRSVAFCHLGTYRHRELV